MSEKRCPHCELVLDAEVGFAKGQGWCRECHKAYWRANQQRENARKREWIRKNPERHKAVVKASYEKHKAARKDYNRRYYLQHRERYAKNRKRWKAANRERLAVYDNTRRARETFRQPGGLKAKEWLAILNMAGRRCIYCGSGQQIEMDHLIPLVRGGEHTKENVAPACLACNRAKGAMTREEFVEFRKRFLLNPPVHGNSTIQPYPDAAVSLARLEESNEDAH